MDIEKPYKNLGVNNDKFLREFKKLYDALHMVGYYRGLQKFRAEYLSVRGDLIFPLSLLNPKLPFHKFFLAVHIS